MQRFIINNAIGTNKRIISVGTTSLRVLETIAKKNKDRFYILDSTQEIVVIQKEISDVLDRFF